MKKYFDSIKFYFQCLFLGFMIIGDSYLINFTIDKGKELVNYMINDFTKSITYHGDNEITEYFVDSVLNNDNLDFCTKKKLLGLTEYIDENQFVDDYTVDMYNSLNVCYPTVDEFPKNENGYILGRYNRESNEIIVYKKDDYDNNFTITHEGIHVSGYFDIKFLNEGMTALINAEYLNHGISNNYNVEINFVKILMELIGRDVILEAYSTYNTDLIYEELAKIGFNRDVALNYVSLIDKFCNDLYDKDIDELKEIIEPIVHLSLNYAYMVDPLGENGAFDSINEYLGDFNGNVYIKNYINLDKQSIEYIKYKY